jgi:ABC-type branched-subunit amino acid transport system substrate-binding protein
MRTLMLSLLLGLVACGEKKPAAPPPTDKPAGDKPAGDTPPADKPTEGPSLKTDFGVDFENKVIKIGALNDESGPAATIGKPYALGKRILAAEVNAGGSGLLPEGWKVELIERDHGYNPQKAVASYNEIKGDVLFIATSFGTPNTLPLLPHLQRDKVVALPASLSSKMAENAFTPPAGPSYVNEARRALDWIAEQGPVTDVKLAVVYQQDDYGADGQTGVKAQAAKHGFNVVAEETVTPGQKDFAAVVTSLKDKGATHVVLTTLPSATGPLLGTAAQLGFTPVWVGLTPSWIDPFFNPSVIPSAVFAKFYWATGLPFWGEDLPGMKGFLAAKEAHAKDAAPDFYTLLSYLQGRLGLDAAKVAIEGGDITREAFVKALQTLSKWDAGGMFQPLDYSKVPYVTGLQIRILQPDFDNKTWKVVAPFSAPKD